MDSVESIEKNRQMFEEEKRKDRYYMIPASMAS